MFSRRPSDDLPRYREKQRFMAGALGLNCMSFCITIAARVEVSEKTLVQQNALMLTLLGDVGRPLKKIIILEG